MRRVVFPKVADECSAARCRFVDFLGECLAARCSVVCLLGEGSAARLPLCFLNIIRGLTTLFVY